MSEVVAVAAAVVLHDGRVLVQTRPAGRHYAGHWEFPGGRVEPGESAAACAERECAEELGLAVRAGPELRVVEWSYPERAVRVTFLECAPADDPPRPRPLDGQELLWADAGELRRLSFLPANAEVVAALIPRLRGA